jgi:hypothetical protein
MRLLLLLTSIAAAIGLAVPAYADGDDDHFLAELRQSGVTFQDPAVAISAAKTVCELVDSGYDDKDIVNNLQLRNPGFTRNGAAKFTTVAAEYYCPNYLTGEGRPPQPPAGG